MTTARRAVSALCRPVVLLGIVALAAVVFGDNDVKGAGTYNPYGSLCLDDITTPAECDGDTSPGAVTDVYSTFNIDEGDYQFYGNVSFLPPAVVNEIDPSTPTGAVTGRLDSIARLGLLNSPCNKTVNVAFTMLNGSTNISNEIFPRPPGSNNVQTPLAQDANGNGLPDGVDKYPSYLNNLFDPDLDEGPDGQYRTGDDVNGPLPPLTPIMRTIGITKVPGATDWIVLQFLIFEPGSKLKDFPSFDASLGYPSVLVLDDPSAPPNQSAISDYCSPLRFTIVWYGVSRDNPCTPAPGPYPCPQRPPINPTQSPALDPDGCDGDTDESNCVNRRNPAAGSYQFSLHSESRRDADGDGIENLLDTCPFDATPDWNPRDDDPTWDPDGDGLVGKADGSAGCDPKPQEQSPGSSHGCPAGLTGPDYEQDCFADRQDNCPLVENFRQVDGDKDEVGDDCDPHPDNPDTEGAEILRDLKWCLTLPGSPQAANGECSEPTPTPPAGPTCQGLDATRVGTERRDAIFGTRGADVIVALGGNDIIFGLGGDDVICAGDGNDDVFGGRDDDTILGEEGHDFLFGESGDDDLYGGSGRDFLYGGRGDDDLYGEDGRDFCRGGSGFDTASSCEKGMWWW